MHEMALAEELLEQVLDFDRAKQAKRVESLQVNCGEQRLVVFDAFKMAWRTVAEGTIAEASTLELKEQPMLARCRICLQEFRPSIDDYRCSRCGEADVDIVEGNDIILESMLCHAVE